MAFQKGHKINFGKKHTQEFKNKKRILMLGNQYNKGRKWSDEVNKKKGLLMEKNPKWNGGKYRTKDGYIAIKIANNKDAGGKNYILEHRLIVGNIIGRKLLKSEVVHHINGIRNDNRIENLILFSSNGSHYKFEKIQEGMKLGEILFDGRTHKKGESKCVHC